MDLANIVAKKQVLVRGIGSVSSGIKISDLMFGGVVVRYLKRLITLVHCLSRSIFGALLEAKFSNFFCDAIYDQRIEGIT